MPIMKWDGTAYLEDVRRHLRSMNCLPVRAMITDGKKAKEIADYLKSVNKNHGGSGYGDVSMYDNTSSCIELKYNKALNDEGARTLTITWNQAAHEIMRMFEEGSMHDPEEEPMQEQALKPGDDIEYDVDTSHLWGNRLTFDELRQMTGELVIVNDFWFPDDTKELDGEGEVLLVINADEDAVTLRRSATETVTIERGDMDEIDSRKDCTAVWSINSEKEEDTSMNEDKTTVIVSEEYTKAVTLTRSIIANAQAAQQSLYEVCKGLKEMRDGKLYKELGYANFEDYTENEVGIKRRQAYNYIMIAENMSAENVQSIAQIGSTKLTMLAMLDEPTREAVAETVDVESVTVKELKAQITALTAERDENEHAAELLSAELDSAKESLASKDKQFKAAMESKDAQLKAAQDAKESAMSECNNLNSIIREKESRIRELEEQPIQHDITDVDSAAEIERLKKELEDEQLRVMMVEKSAESKARLAAKSVREEYEKKLAEQDTAADTKDVFKAYLANAADALTRLLTYLESIRDDKNLPLYISKVDGIVEMTQTRRNAL